MIEGVSVWFFLLLVLLPSITVFIVCYVLIKQFLKNREQMQFIAIQKESTATTLPLKLQAYERLILLFERIQIPNLIAKLRTKRMSSGDLQSALMISIQQEFEHNVTQQMYVSDSLWEIIRLSKQELFNQLQQKMIDVAFTEDVDTYSNALIEHFSGKGGEICRKALFAIKQEAKLYL